jgi:hypothetical protein
MVRQWDKAKVRQCNNQFSKSPAIKHRSNNPAISSNADDEATALALP